MTVAIIADGEFPETEYPQYLIKNADAVVCCDGSLIKYLQFSHGKAPDAIVGDMDTLSEEMKAQYSGMIVKYDEQDFDDLAKAVRYAVETYGGGIAEDSMRTHGRQVDDRQEYIPYLNTIHIFGASGGAEDFTIGNYGLLMHFCEEYPDISFDAVSDFTTAFPLTGDTEFDCGCGRTVSIFSPDPTLRIRSTGLEWPLDNVCFDNWWKGIRNKANDDRVTLKFNHPSKALVILD